MKLYRELEPGEDTKAGTYGPRYVVPVVASEILAAVTRAEKAEAGWKESVKTVESLSKLGKMLERERDEARAACAKKDEALRDAKDILTMEKEQGRFEFGPMILKLQSALADGCGKELLAELERLRAHQIKSLRGIYRDSDHWIARSEREPKPEDFEPTGDVLIWHKDGGIYVITGGETYDAYTHWRKITPPQEEKNDALRAKLDEMEARFRVIAGAASTDLIEERLKLIAALRRALEELNEVQILMKDRWSSKALRDIAKILGVEK